MKKQLHALKHMPENPTSPVATAGRDCFLIDNVAAGRISLPCPVSEGDVFLFSQMF